MKQIIFSAGFLLMLSLPIFCQTNGDICPKYEIIGPSTVVTPGNIGFFEIKGDENFQKLNLSYVWTISDGMIFAGQGTAGIFVASDTKKDIDIKANVKIGGLPASCDNTLSETGAFTGIPKAVLVDESGRAALPDNVKARLDSYFTQLQNNPSADGFIVFKSKTKSAVIEQTKKLSNYLFFRGQDLSRFVYRIIISKNDENTAYWVVPGGAEFPSEDGAINIRASEYANIKNFFAAAPRKK